MNPPKILIVEDEIIISEHISFCLEEFGYAVCGRVISGPKAQEAVADLKPDLVLMDIRLQGAIDGIEAAGVITEQYKTPVIFLTAHMDKGLLERAKQVNPCGYLIKPIQKQLLIANIEIALHMSEINRQRRDAQASLRTSELRLRSLIESSEDLIIELDDQFRIRFMNRPLPGFSHEQVIGRPLTDFVSVTASNTRHPFQEVLAQSESLSCEASFQDPEGRTIYYELRISKHPGLGEGNTAALIVSLRDLTSIQELTRKLLDRERWLANTFQQAAVGIIHIDAEGHFLRVNERYAAIMGYPVAELLNRNFLEYTEPAYHDRQQVERQRLISGDVDTISLEKRNIRRDGQAVWVNLTLSRVSREDGSLEYLLGIVKDVTDRKKAEAALQESEEKYRELIEHIPQRITYKNKDLKYIAVNRRFADDLDRQVSEIEGKTAYDLFPQELADQFQAEDLEVLSRGTNLAVDQEIILKNENRIFRAIKVPKRNKKGVIEGVLAVYTDITEQVESEKIRKNLERNLQQTQKMQALGTLAGGVAHDFNNILHPIIGLATLGSRSNPEDSSNYKYFKDIRKAGNRAKELVSQILTFSRQGKQELKPILLSPLIKEALKMLRASLPTTIDIETSINESCGKVKADPTQMHQIIMNLATNGFQAMEKTGGRLSVSLQPLVPAAAETDETTQNEGVLVELRVSDTGIGISPENLEKIFDPYFTTKEVGHGTGLGLAVVRGIVESHHGTIHVDSTPGQGTEVTICLPVTHVTVEKVSFPAEKRRLTGDEHILVVDDEEDIIFFLQEALKRLGYQVSGTSSSAEALEWFKADPQAYDVVVTDMTMPVMTGYDLAMNMLQIKPGIPIVLCTGHSANVNEERAIASGIRRFLPKPIDQDDLAAAIRDAVDGVG